jgi:hypothetical protein
MLSQKVQNQQAQDLQMMPNPDIARIQRGISRSSSKTSEPRTPTTGPSRSPICPPSPITPSRRSRYQATTQETEPLIDFVIDNATFEPTFYVSSKRPYTEHGLRKQEAHASPYICFLHMVYNLMTNNDIKLAPERILAIVNIFLPDQEDRFNVIVQNYRDRIKELLDPSERKIVNQVNRSTIGLTDELSRLLDDSTFKALLESMPSATFPHLTSLGAIKSYHQIISVNRDKLSKVKKTLSFNEVNLLCQLIKDMANEMLKSMNMDTAVSFLKIEESDSKDSDPVKIARYGLCALDILIGLLPSNYASLKNEEIIEQITDLDVEKIHEITSISNSQFKTGLKKLCGLLPANTDARKSEGGKFDRKIKKLEQKDDKKELLIFIIEKLRVINVVGTISKLVTELFDFKYCQHQQTPDIMHILAIVCAKHLAIAGQCFLNLSSEDLKKEWQKSFLTDGVLKENGWSQFQVMTAGNRKSSKVVRTLDSNLLIQEINGLSSDPKYSKIVECLSLEDSVKATDRKRKSGVSETILDSTDSAIDNGGKRPKHSPCSPVRVSPRQPVGFKGD